jgi:hypothetical protein
MSGQRTVNIVEVSGWAQNLKWCRVGLEGKRENSGTSRIRDSSANLTTAMCGVILVVMVKVAPNMSLE